MERTSLEGPDERRALGDERPARAEAEQTNAFVRGASAEQVAHKVMSSIISQTDDGNCSEERERVLRDPVKRLSERERDTHERRTRTTPNKRWRRTRSRRTFSACG